MQERAHDDHHGGASGTSASGASGILENTNGVTVLTRAHVPIAVCDAGMVYKTSKDRRFKTYQIPALSWTHNSGLLLLQGASLQQLLQPFFIIRIDPRPIYAPRPGADRVVLVSLFDQKWNKDKSREEIYNFLFSHPELTSFSPTR